MPWFTSQSSFSSGSVPPPNLVELLDADHRDSVEAAG